MSIRIFCSVLVVALLTQANEPAIYKAEASNSKYLLVPASKCAAVADKMPDICTPQKLPFDIDNLNLVPSLTSGYFEVSFKASTESDEKELLCYRCTLGKGSQDKCGRYKNVWQDRKWTENCPKPKD